MADVGYAAAVKETFENKPLRTVLMIDDQFPNLSDMIRGSDVSDKFSEKKRALVLYEGFRSRHMICDVENQVSDVHTERLRKSDLVILDYNLGPVGGDNEQCLRVLRELAGSKHFNTVVVYTADPEQDEVWLSIIGSLSGDWNGLPGGLTGEAQEHWERLSDKDELPGATLEAIMYYAKARSLHDIPPNVVTAARDELSSLGVPPGAAGPVIEALIHKEMASRSGRWAGEPRRRAVGGFADGIRWVQSHNSFIAILKKEEDCLEGSDDPYGIMTCLSRALLAWRPNLIQILISEIQNILELEALATEDEQLGEPQTQAALWYYLLQASGSLDLNSSPDVRAPMMSLIDKLVDGIRRRLSTDEKLVQLATNAMLGDLRDDNWHLAQWPDPKKSALVKGATKLARVNGKADQKDVLFRLNAFLSTERFRRAHITTGTIFRANGELWVATSPACDLVARRPSSEQAWSHEIHPLTAIVALRLRSARTVQSALNEATHANHIFLYVDGAQQAFKITNADAQPSYEFLFLSNEGKVEHSGEKITFSGRRLRNGTGGNHELMEEAFEVIGQLKNMNATRILQTAGHHLSRIGLDFVNLPPN